MKQTNRIASRIAACRHWPIRDPARPVGPQTARMRSGFRPGDFRMWMLAAHFCSKRLSAGIREYDGHLCFLRAVSDF